MKTNPTMRRGFTLVELLVVIVIIAALAGLTAPMVIRQRKKADQTEAVNNARQIGLALIEFENEYGYYPDDTTKASVAQATGKTAVTGTDANARFRQLFSAGMTQSESMFYAKTAYTKKADNKITTDADFLEGGSCAFGIVMKSATEGFSSAGNPSRPICGTPFKKALDGTFDPDYYDGKAVILKMDNSVVSVPISTSDFFPQINGKSWISKATGGAFDGEAADPVATVPSAKP